LYRIWGIALKLGREIEFGCGFRFWQFQGILRG